VSNVRPEMSLSNLLKAYIETLVGAAAYGSAAFWYEAASITTGGSAPDVVQQLRRLRQGKLNRRAALCGGISALLAAFALVVWS